MGTSISGNFYKNLFKLSLPIALEGLIVFSFGVADAIMIGRLGDIGISGIYMGNQIQMLLQVLCVGIEGAILGLSSQYWGREDAENVRKISSIGILMSVSVGVLLTILCTSFPAFAVGLFTNKAEIIDTGAGYLKVLSISFPIFCLSRTLIASMRSVEKTSVGFFSSAIALAVKIFLNYMLVFGNLGAPKLEIRGAAISTLVARATEVLILLIYVFISDKRLSFKIKDLFKIDKSRFSDFFKYGTPIILGQLVWAVNILASSAIIGRVDSVSATAALGVANTLNGLAYVLCNGVSAALGIITGKSVGAGEYETVRKNTKKAQIIFVVIGILTGAVIQFSKLPFISVYNLSANAISEAKAFINVLSVTAPATAYQSACLFGILKNGGDSAFVFKVEALSVFCAVLPAALIAWRLGFSPATVFAALKCDQPIKCIPAAIRVNKFKWIKNITEREKRPQD